MQLTDVPFVSFPFGTIWSRGGNPGLEVTSTCISIPFRVRPSPTFHPTRWNGEGGELAGFGLKQKPPRKNMDWQN
eukprot:scaffold652378_cov47-Attheya_sp.AAC.1